MQDYYLLQGQPAVDKKSGKIIWVRTYTDDEGKIHTYEGSCKTGTQVFTPEEPKAKN